LITYLSLFMVLYNLAVRESHVALAAAFGNTEQQAAIVHAF